MSSIEKAIDRLAKVRSGGKIPQVVDVSPSGSEQLQDTITANESDKKLQHNDHQFQPSVTGAAEGPQNDANQTKDLNTTAPESNAVDLDLAVLKKAGYITPDCDNKELFEEYRIIKRPLLMNAYGKGAAPIEYGNLIMVTSSLPGEGKTFTTLNLALSIISELDSTVLIVDGDVLRSSLSKLLGLDDRIGLTDVLLKDSVGIEDVVVSTQIPKLEIIPAGTKYENSTELLASDAMTQLVKEVGGRYKHRIVLFDSPPLLATSESMILVQLMGQILMVVEAGKTPVNAVKDSLSHIDNEKVVGLVLNKTHGRAKIHGYGNYYGYGYGGKY